MKNVLTKNKTKPKYKPTLSKEEQERKAEIQNKRKSTINKNKRIKFIDELYKKYE
jgi:hypothetical protein